MELKINIEMDNAAFDRMPEREAVRILRKLADKIESTGDMDHALMDINGNKVGRSDVTE